MTGTGTTDTTDEPTTVTTKPGSWRDLFGPGHFTPALVLASGVAIYALTVFVTAALMPSIVADIGGGQYYAWVTTAFLIASVIASMQVSRLLERRGASGAYLIAFGLFALGSLIITASRVMEMLLVGRFIQGFGGGLLAGLGYAVIRSALPGRLWTRAAGLISAMWGVGTLVGPALGGVFASLGWWRLPFVILTVLTVVLGYLGWRALPRGSGGAAARRSPMPVASLVALTSAAAAFSITSILPQGLWTAVGVIGGLVLILGFVLAESRGTATVLPRLTYRARNPLKWIYLALAALCAGVMTEMFIPLFGQELGGLNPLTAGFFGATISVGWTVTQLFSVNLTSDRAIRLAIRVGPLVVAAGLIAYGLMQTEGASRFTVVWWSIVLIVAGAGIGVAFPHLGVAAMSSTTDEQEGAKAAAGVSTTQLIANAVASALAGILVSLGSESTLAAVRYMAFGIAVIAVLGAVAARFASRRLCHRIAWAPSRPVTESDRRRGRVARPRHPWRSGDDQSATPARRGAGAGPTTSDPSRSACSPGEIDLYYSRSPVAPLAANKGLSCGESSAWAVRVAGARYVPTMRGRYDTPGDTVSRRPPRR